MNAPTSPGSRLLLLLALAVPAVGHATTQAQYTQLLQDAGRQAEDGREALAVLTVLASREGSDSAINALRELVLAATPKDAVLTRHALGNDGTLVRDPQRAQQLLASLQALDPGNANNGLVALALTPADLANPAVGERLDAIAAAPRYASDFAAMVQAAHRALSRVSWPDDVIAQAQHDAGTTPAMVVSVSIAAAVASPDFDKLVKACDHVAFPDRAVSCRRIGRRLLADAGTMVDQLVGASVLGAAASDDASTTEALAAQRRVQWQGEQANRLIASAPGAGASPDRVRYSAEVLAKGELPGIHALFARNHVALDPPTHWQPQPPPVPATKP